MLTLWGYPSFIIALCKICQYSHKSYTLKDYGGEEGLL